MSTNRLDNLAKLLADPKVNKILEAARVKDGVTVKQLAKTLNEKPANLYYPVQKMTDFELLKVVAENEIKNLTEKVYSSAHLYNQAHQKEIGLKENDIDLSSEYLAKHKNDLLELLMINQKRTLESFKENIDFIQADGKDDDTTFSWVAGDFKLSKRGRFELLKRLQKALDFKDPYPNEPKTHFNVDVTLYSNEKPENK